MGILSVSAGERSAPIESNEQLRVIWRPPKGLFQTVEASGLGNFGIPFRYRETAYTANRDARGVAHKEIQPAPPNGGRPAGGPRIPLTDKEEKEMIDLYFYKNIPQSEIAEKFGISQQAVSKRIKKICTKIRKQAEILNFRL